MGERGKRPAIIAARTAPEFGTLDLQPLAATTVLPKACLLRLPTAAGPDVEPVCSLRASDCWA